LQVIGGRFDRVCERISTGEPKWLEVARRLRPASDAASSLSLDYAVARAIPKHPERVLALIDKGFSLERVCTSPFIEPETGVAQNYQRRAVAALARVRDPKLTGLASSCSARIAHPLPPH